MKKRQKDFETFFNIEQGTRNADEQKESKIFNDQYSLKKYKRVLKCFLILPSVNMGRQYFYSSKSKNKTTIVSRNQYCL